MPVLRRLGVLRILGLLRVLRVLRVLRLLRVLRILRLLRILGILRLLRILGLRLGHGLRLRHGLGLSLLPRIYNSRASIGKCGNHCVGGLVKPEIDVYCASGRRRHREKIVLNGSCSLDFDAFFRSVDRSSLAYLQVAAVIASP